MNPDNSIPDKVVGLFFKSPIWRCVLNNISNYAEKIKDIIHRNNPDVIYIPNIEKHTVNIEKEAFFKGIVSLFIEKEKENDSDYKLGIDDIYSNTQMYRKFIKFFLLEIALWNKIKIKNSSNIKNNLDVALLDFEINYWYATKSITKFYDNIYKIIYEPIWLEKSDLGVKVEMLGFLKAYHMMKEAFSWGKRKLKDANWNPERSFNHSKETMNIILNELPEASRTRIIAALLHDAKEDLGYSYDTLSSEFWIEIANVVKHLSKKDWREYLNINEKEEVESIEWNKTANEKINEEKDNKRYRELIKKWKEFRNQEYFWNIKALDKDTRYVKYADRIHNLRTLHEHPLEKKIDKIIETEKYFYEIAYQDKLAIEKKEYYNLIDIMKWTSHAIDLMEKEIRKLLKDKEVYNLYIKKSKEIWHKCPVWPNNFTTRY